MPGHGDSDDDHGNAGSAAAAPAAASPRRAGKGKGKGKREVPLPKRIRDLKRLLKKDTLAADARVAQERILASLEMQLEERKAERAVAEKERKHQARYRKIKFFEMQKLRRALKKAEADGDEQGALDARKKMHYVTQFPKTQRYISVLKPESEMDPGTVERRRAVFAAVGGGGGGGAAAGAGGAADAAGDAKGKKRKHAVVGEDGSGGGGTADKLAKASKKKKSGKGDKAVVGGGAGQGRPLGDDAFFSSAAAPSDTCKRKKHDGSR